MTGTPLQNFSDRELKFSYWYVTNKLLWRKLLVVFLLLAIFGLWFYIVWQMAFFTANYTNEQSQLRRLVFADNRGLLSIGSAAPQSIQVSESLSLANDDGRVDYLSQIVNPNADWLAVFDYQFDGSARGAYKQQGFIFPGERKYLMGLGIAGAVSGLEISNIRWQRISNYDRDHNERFRFEVGEENFIAGQTPGDPNLLVFNLTNHSAYSYWQAGVQAFLYSGGNIVSINRVAIDQFKAGETRRVQLNWNTRLPRIDKTEIIADVNVFDSGNIMPPEGGIDRNIP